MIFASVNVSVSRLVDRHNRDNNDQQTKERHKPPDRANPHVNLLLLRDGHRVNSAGARLPWRLTFLLSANKRRERSGGGRSRGRHHERSVTSYEPSTYV